jgi:hypothetical protein
LLLVWRREGHDALHSLRTRELLLVGDAVMRHVQLERDAATLLRVDDGTDGLALRASRREGEAWARGRAAPGARRG